MTRRRESIRTTPAYVATGGRSSLRHPLPDVLTRLTPVSAPSDDGLTPPQHRLLSAVIGGQEHGGDLTLAEAASHMKLPLSAVRVLVNDLLAERQITVTEPATGPDIHLLESVRDGLRRLKFSA